MHRLAALTAVVAALIAAPVATAAKGGAIETRSSGPLEMAVIGDTPYGGDQVERFPGLIADINLDPKVRLALHVGDVKTGGSLCSDAYLARIRSLFDTFRDPLVYTPGDNEWTDCHRPAAGGYLPTERLAAVRALFYPEPGATLGRRPKRVLTQSDERGFEPFVENQLWMQSRVVFSAVHVVGSNNGLAPWFGAAETEAQRAERLREYRERLAADLAWIDEAFDSAERREARGVVLAMQADMWDGPPFDGFDEIVERLAERAREFGRPVLLLEGDSHRFLVDRPLAAGSPAHGVTTAAPNVTRVVVEGETVDEWLRVRVDPRAPEVFSLRRMRR